MSKLISNLLGADPISFNRMINRLEHVSVQKGIDVGLTAEIITQTREKSRSLGLDPTDTTPKELYFALLAKAAEHGELLRSRLGITDTTSQESAAKKIAIHSEELLKKDDVVVIQSMAVKKILKSVPPKKTLKTLNFRSIDSVLKRENPLLVYALAKKLEDKTWHSQVLARIKRLDSRDAHEASIQVLSLPKEWLKKLDKVSFDKVIQPVPEIGCILILPTMPLTVKGSVLLTTVLVLQAGQKLAIESLPFRAKSMRISLEKLLPDITAGVLDDLTPIHGLVPTWSTVYRLLAEQSKHLVPDFEFILGDLHWESTETRLSLLVPECDFWLNTHYLGFFVSPLPVSLHLIDVSASLVLDKDYESQVVSHLRSSLWNELQIRYLKHDSLEKRVISQLSFA